MEERFEELLKFSEDFRVAKEKEEEKLPYHINVIDELHINENAHSRVLTKLLQYKKREKEYVILQSLLDNIVEKSSDFKRIKIAKPTITQEKERIDLWICDEDYAIIFENKIYNAADQDAQICRYIERTKEKKYKEEQIFVIYLSRDGKEPDDQSWGSYKESFKSRYVNLSFRYDILPWLKNDVLPNIHQNDVYLFSALLQYIFFLEGDKMFRTGGIYKNMNMKLNKMIEEHYLHQNASIESKIAELLKDEKNVSEVIKQMDILKKEYFNTLYKEWSNKIKEEFNLEPELFLGNKEWAIIKVRVNGFEITLSGGTKDTIDELFYCGMSVTAEDKEYLKEKLGLQEENSKADDISIFNSFSLSDYEDGYKKVFDFFNNLITKCIEISKK